MFFRARELQPEQAILLTYPKAQPFLNKLDFHEITRETRGMTFGLYVRKDIPEEFEIAFVRALVFAYNLCKKKFMSPGITGKKYQRKLLQKMNKIPGFIIHYGLGTFQDI